MTRFATRDIPESYELWNEALADRFFPVGHEQPVFLDPDDATLADIAGGAGDPVNWFVESVKETLWLPRPSSFLNWHDEWFEDWRSSRRDQTPPFVGLLALFSYASTRMKDDRGYYEPLCDLVGVGDVDAVSRCYNRRVRYYWSALNGWIETSRRGTPTAYPQDARANVSLLLTQRFLSAAERAMLPAFLERSGLTPGTTLTKPEMEDHIRRNVHHLPVELLGEWRRHPDRFAEISSIELESWTGRQGAGDITVEAPLLLGLYFDRRRGGVQFPFATTSAAAPQGEYFFQGASDESEVTRLAIAELGGTVIFDLDDGLRFARGPRLSTPAIAAVLNEDVEISSKSGFRLHRKPAKVILFLPLSANSYLEAPGRRLPLGSRFTLLATDEITHGEAFSELTAGAQSRAVEGLPAGWRLYRDVELRSLPQLSTHENLPKEIQRLAPLPHDAVIDIRGGIPVAGPTRAGRAWLAFLVPEVVVAGPLEDVEVQLHLRPYDGVEGAIETLRAVGDGSFVRSNTSSPLPAGDHQLFVVRQSKTLTQCKLRVVSSDTPRPESRSLAYSAASPWRALSAGPEKEAPCNIRGAYWSDLRPTAGDPPITHPPVALTPPALPIEEVEDHRAALGVTPDLRPEQYRRRLRPRRRVTLHSLGDTSLPGRYGPQLAEAVASGADNFKAADGTTWRIRYFDNGEIVVRPANVFVPMARFKVADE
jgi:hypothetical protein